mgnify:CR=1 FL=1
MATAHDLQQTLHRLDRRGYKAYKDIQGHYQFPQFTLMVDHVQGDPFAAPSRLRVMVPQTVAQFPAELYRTRIRAIALRDYLNRQFECCATHLQEKRGSGNSGLISILSPRQQVLERSAVWIDAQSLEVRFWVGLPARGRTVLGDQAAELLCQDLPQIVQQTLLYASLNAGAIARHVKTVEDAEALRKQLADRNLVAFIPDGAILPRRSGVDDRPLTQEAIAFHAPESLRVALTRPNQGAIAGLGIPRGITLIVGGGYHGKSTLLKAIALGVYNHIPGDGREAVVTDPTAMKVRAEDGRSVAGVNISPFINNLPLGRSTIQFSTENASGSTSQAANIMEALEAGAALLLVDEDTSATNFMIRDRRMQALITKDQEPITPFLDKVRQLYEQEGVSTILVMGGSGDYFDVADTVIAMTEFQPQDVTAQAKAIAQQYATDRLAEGGQSFGDRLCRIPQIKRLDSPKRRDEEDSRRPKLKVRDVDEMIFGTEAIDLSAVEQLVEVGQLRAIGAAITQLQEKYLDGRTSLSDLIDRLLSHVDTDTLDWLTPYPQGDLVAFRRLELAAVINRLRSLRIRA